MADNMVELADRLEAAASREGKPRGDHMIVAHEAIAKTFGRRENDKEAQNLADVADTTAHCLRAEVAMVEGLQAVALEAAAFLRARAALKGE